MDIKQDFKVYCSTNFKELNKSLIEDTFRENNELILEGIASTTSIDEDGDYMTKECLEDMKRQAIGLSVLKEHGRKLDDVIGKVISIPESDSDKFKIKFKVLPSWEWYLMEFLDNEINLGLSIGAKAIDYEPNEDSDYGWKVNKAKLYEISLVPLPANWDSFGSVKMSKELDDNVIVAKCFNGACKQLVETYSQTSISKEIEDAEVKDEEKFLTKKDAINLINEASLGIYERVLSEVLDETKNMIEKYHLNNEKKDEIDEKSDESEKSNDKKIDENSSKKKEDEEKNKSMKEEIDKKVETEETPDVQKNLEETEGTSIEKEVEVDEEKVEKELEAKEVDVTVSVDEVSNADVLKSIDEMKSFMAKSINEEIEKQVNEKVAEMKKNLRKEVEDELFKELTTERVPVETEQPKVEVEKEVETEEEEQVNKAMTAHDIAKMLCS